MPSLREATKTRPEPGSTATELGWRTVGNARSRSGWSPARSSTSSLRVGERHPEAIAGEREPVGGAGQRDAPGDLQPRLGRVDEDRAAAGVGHVDPAPRRRRRRASARARRCARLGPGACAGHRARRCRPGRRRRRPGRRRRRSRRAGCRRGRCGCGGRRAPRRWCEPRSSAVKIRPSSPAVASCGCLPTGVARSPPPGSETSTSSFAGSDGTSTGPPGSASCRCRGGPGSGTRLRTLPSRSSSTSSSGSLTPTATSPVLWSNTTPSGLAPTSTTRPAGFVAGSGAAPGSAALGGYGLRPAARAASSPPPQPASASASAATAEMPAPAWRRGAQGRRRNGRSTPGQVEVRRGVGRLSRAIGRSNRSRHARGRVERVCTLWGVNSLHPRPGDPSPSLPSRR